METYEQNMGYPPEPEQNSETAAPVNKGQRRDVGAAAAGTVVLGAAAYALSRMDDSDGNGDGDGSDESLSGLSNGDGSGLNDGSNGSSGASSLVQPVALTDANANANANSGKGGSDGNLNLEDMTFDEAFAAARQAQGPGHHFTWHGGMYNTFFQEELDKMSMSERLAFVDTLDLPDDSDDNGPAPARRTVSEGHHRAHPQHHSREESPALADNHPVEQPAPSVEPMTVVPIVAASATPEVVPLSADSHTDNADLLMAESTTEHSDGMIGPSIDSIDDHSHGSDEDHSDASGDDHDVHFTY